MNDNEFKIWRIVAIIGIACFIIGVALGASLIKSSFEEGKFCPKCGAHYSDTDLYCTNDGTELLIISGNQ